MVLIICVIKCKYMAFYMNYQICLKQVTKIGIILDLHGLYM